MALRIAEFLALVLTALALVPSGAHLAALPGKIDLSAERYVVVQAIYRGWSLFGLVLIGAIVATGAATVLSWGMGTQAFFPLVACALMIGTLALFAIYIYPANQATRDWTEVTSNWEYLRGRWEYAHATNALLTFFAFVAMALGVVVRGG